MSHADSNGVVVEFSSGVASVTPADVPGYQNIRIPGLALAGDPGDPALPVTGALIGLPPGTRMMFEVVEAEFQVVDGVRPPPVARPGLAEFTHGTQPEGPAYGARGLYPEAPVSEGFTGAMRDQAVAQLLFHPVRFNPATGEARLYTRIVVSVRFVPDPNALVKGRDRRRSRGAFGTRPDPYEEVLADTVINYHALERR